MIRRDLYSLLSQKLHDDDKVIVLYGPRQVGKTTLAHAVLDDSSLQSIRINAEISPQAKALSSRDPAVFEDIIGGAEILFIVEALFIENVGLNLKILHDHLPHVKIFVTGSSAFEISQDISEPLTGRAWTYTLYPISYTELATSHTPHQLREQLSKRLVYGSYPEAVTTTGAKNKQQYLIELSSQYLFKDIFTFAQIKHHRKIRDLLQLLAYQIGSEVSVHTLANELNISRNAVNNYIDLLEKSFVLFRLGGFSRNLRKEVRKMDKLFFYDLGIRNALIQDFKPLDQRDDVGQLWENFLIIERQKRNQYQRHFTNQYFWRLHTGAELDYLEEHSAKQYGYEFKWGEKMPNAPKSWVQEYPDSEYAVVNRHNFLDFIT